MAPPPHARPDAQAPAEGLSATLVQIVDNLDAMVAYWNVDRLCVFANAAYVSWFGKTREQIVGRSMKDLLGPLYEANLPYIDAAFAGRKQVFERDIPRPEGGIRHSLATYAPHVVDGQVRGIFVHAADVSPLKEIEHQLREAKELAERSASHDPLTGLPNRRLLHETTERVIANARRCGEALAMMSIDVDHFKAINDAHGHAGGDATLVELASRLREGVRACDTVFRVGGDEFVALLPALQTRHDSLALASRLLEACREPLVLQSGTVRPTITIGIAHLSERIATAQALLRESDRALYEAKRGGRNRLEVVA